MAHKTVPGTATVPQIPGLIGSTRRLYTRFQKLSKQHKKSESLVFKYPLSLNWRPYVGQTNLPKDVRDGITFTRGLAKYVGDLSLLFVDWQDRPDRFQRFPLSRWVRVYKSMEPVTGDQLLGMLKEHERLLRLEEARVAAKGPVVIESTMEEGSSHNESGAHEIPAGEIAVGAKSVPIPHRLSKELKQAMRRNGHRQKQACSAMEVDAKTLRKLLSGRGKVLQRTIENATDYAKR